MIMGFLIAAGSLVLACGFYILLFAAVDRWLSPQHPLRKPFVKIDGREYRVRNEIEVDDGTPPDLE